MNRQAGAIADEPTLRAAICAAGRRLGARGLISAAEGNLSVRLAGDVLLMTPAGRRKDELDPGDLATVLLDPRADPPATGPHPSSDIAIHRAIYRLRSDVVAIAHAHVPAAMALSLAGAIPDPAALPETAMLLPVLPFVPFAAMGSDELASRIAGAFVTDGPPLPGAVVLERHGAVAVGASSAAVDGDASAAETGTMEAALIQAVDRLELVDVLCRAWRDALLLRAALGRTGQIGLATD